MKGRIVKLFAAALLTLLGPVVHATVTYVYTDPQGTPLAEANASGVITATFDYSPYGRRVMGNPTPGPGYTGHVEDPDTGFVYMQARYYDPVVGRFLSVDPVEVRAADLFNLNRFSYANGNPILNIDADGRETGAGYASGEYQMAQPVMTDDAARIFTGLIPVVGDVQNIQDAYNDPSAANIIFAAIGVIPEVGGEAVALIKEAKALEKVGVDSERMASKASKMQRQVERGQAPRNIKDVHGAHDSPGAQDHVHFKDGTSMNKDGSIHDAHRGVPKPTRADKRWLESHHWPTEPKKD